MIQKFQQNGYALITGASYGLGDEYARQLAARGWSLILVARSQDRLEVLRAGLLAKHTNVDIRCIPLDLTAQNAAVELFRRTQEANLDVNLLINNAGFGAFGEFISIDRERQRKMIDLNIGAVVELSHIYLQPMAQRHSGVIVNIASVTGFFPLPYCAVYAATKAFVLSFSNALQQEALQHGVHVMTVNPGSTRTNFFQVAGMSLYGNSSHMRSAASVVNESLHALDRGKGSITTGIENRLLLIATSWIPRRWIAAVVGKQLGRQMRRMRPSP